MQVPGGSIMAHAQRTKHAHTARPAVSITCKGLGCLVSGMEFSVPVMNMGTALASVQHAVHQKLQELGVGTVDQIGDIVRLRLVHLNREASFDLAVEAPLAEFASADELQCGLAFVAVCGRLRPGEDHPVFVPHGCFLPGSFVVPPVRDLVLVAASHSD